MHIRKIFIIFAIQLTIAAVVAVFFIFFILPKNVTTFPKNFVQVAQALSPHSITPVISNQWFSSILSSFPTSPLYALPLVYQLSPQGIAFSYPEIHKKPDTISAPFTQDFVLGYETPLQKPVLTSVTDWTISASMKSTNTNTMSFTIGHGLPYGIVQTNNTVIITPSGTYRVFNQKNDTLQNNFSATDFGLTSNNRNYIFVFTKKVLVKRNENVITLENPGRIFVGLLDTTAHYQLFKSASQTDINDTQVLSQIGNDRLTLEYVISAKNGIPLITLYPHQSSFLTTKKDILGTYESIRGPLELIQSNDYTTSQNLIIPPTTFLPLKNDYTTLDMQIKNDIAEIIKQQPPNSKDYYLGTWFGKISNLLLLADTMHLEKEKQKLLAYTEPIFLKSLQNFDYNNKKTSVIAKFPEFGNENLNDHHFHYGYYIRTAAVLANFDLPFLSKVQSKIHTMVADIATTQRDESSYPYLRNFDVYESHSYADGFGEFADGNDEESSSEAVNAWYGVYLWSQVIHDQFLEKTALTLYNQEIQGAYFYWFDTHSIYTSPYEHAIASLVWGGKVDFATWFSTDTTLKYAIELLPFTPASLYLGTMPNFTHYLTDFTQSGGSLTRPGGDLMIMWQSFYEPTKTIADINRTTNFQTDNSRSIYLYTLYKNYEERATVNPTL